ncbi:MAG: MerR family transcriptional regulator, partial [Alphaproteobacteria bacterium]|nr:MerR family transcriptional regulator [Alphaproteobacteria bacterium]
MTAEEGGALSIGEVASELDVPSHVLRFWETRFAEIRPAKRGNRRVYGPADLALLRGIRQLLYTEGLTVKGVQKVLAEQGAGFVREIGTLKA